MKALWQKKLCLNSKIKYQTYICWLSANQSAGFQTNVWFLCLTSNTTLYETGPRNLCGLIYEGGLKSSLGWLRRSCATVLNETWHALNSTFPDTNCIVFFQISNSGLWKVVLETFQNDLENWQRESRFTRTMLLHTSLCLQWLMCVTVAYPPYSPDLAPSIFCSPIWKKPTWLGSSIWPMMRSYLQNFEDFCKDQEESFYTTAIQALQHQWKKCVYRRGDYVKK